MRFFYKVSRKVLNLWLWGKHSKYVIFPVDSHAKADLHNVCCNNLVVKLKKHGSVCFGQLNVIGKTFSEYEDGVLLATAFPSRLGRGTHFLTEYQAAEHGFIKSGPQPF